MKYPLNFNQQVTHHRAIYRNYLLSQLLSNLAPAGVRMLSG
jgi:hypothetical protein